LIQLPNRVGVRENAVRRETVHRHAALLEDINVATVAQHGTGGELFKEGFGHEGRSSFSIRE
jgi:hypothetical protein